MFIVSQSLTAKTCIFFLIVNKLCSYFLVLKGELLVSLVHPGYTGDREIPKI